MLKLIKYDWRRINFLFYSLMGAAIIFQLLLVIVDRKFDWWDEITVGAAFAITSTLMQVLLIMFIYNFNSSLKSVTRRLLPVSAVKEYISHLILPTVFFTIFGLELFLFVVLFSPDFYLPGLNEFVAEVNIVEAFFSVLTFSVFYSVLSFMMYFLAVAITRLFKTNAKIIIFIGLIILFSIIYSVIYELLQTNPEVLHQGNIRFEATEGGYLSIHWFEFSWTMLIDLALMAIMSSLTVYIIKNKLEV